MITLYYYEDLNLREIGAVLGVTESRVSQMHSKAMLHLRARFSREFKTAIVDGSLKTGSFDSELSDKTGRLVERVE